MKPRHALDVADLHCNPFAVCLCCSAIFIQGTITCHILHCSYSVCRREASSGGGREESQWGVHPAPPVWGRVSSGRGEEEAGRETAGGWRETGEIAQWRTGECPNSLVVYSFKWSPRFFFFLKQYLRKSCKSTSDIVVISGHSLALNKKSNLWH